MKKIVIVENVGMEVVGSTAYMQEAIRETETIKHDF